MQAFIERRLYHGDKLVTKLMLNAPPRHCKTLTIERLCQWALGRDYRESIILVCYNSRLSSRGARHVRDGITERKRGKGFIFRDFFPDTKIKRGDASVSEWSLEGSEFSFLATSPDATITGIGGSIIIVDDLIKNYREACTERILSEHWEFYNNTLKSRQDRKFGIIPLRLVLMTRWATKDLCGRLIESEKDEWFVMTYKACIDEEKKEMLAPNLFPYEAYAEMIRTSEVIARANYQQGPIDIKSLLYSEFKTYKELPETNNRQSYTDTADGGGDWHCTINAAIKDGTAYVVDIIYNQDGMEDNERRVAKSFIDDEIQLAYIESNNGGEGFARNVEREIRGKGNLSTVVKTFHQGANKKARILSNASSVTNGIIMPHGWEKTFSEFHKAVTMADNSGKWKHDDAMDALTGIVEKVLQKQEFEVYTL